MIVLPEYGKCDAAKQTEDLWLPIQGANLSLQFLLCDISQACAIVTGFKLGLTASCIGRSSSTRADALRKTQRTTTHGRTGRP